MSTTELNWSEKASLSQLARRLVERGARATADDVRPRESVAATDHFSEDGQLLRVLELEKRLEAIGRDWSKTLSTVLLTVERLEARVSRLDGEVQGLHDREENLERSIKHHSDELTGSATIFAETAATKLEAALVRVDRLLSTHGLDNSAEVSINKTVAQRG